MSDLFFRYRLNANTNKDVDIIEGIKLSKRDWFISQFKIKKLDPYVESIFKKSNPITVQEYDRHTMEIYFNSEDCNKIIE